MKRIIAIETKVGTKETGSKPYITEGKIYDILPNEGTGERFIDDDGHILDLEYYMGTLNCFKFYEGDKPSDSTYTICPKCGHHKFEYSGDAFTVYKGVTLGGRYGDVIEYDSVKHPNLDDLDHTIVSCTKCQAEV